VDPTRPGWSTGNVAGGALLRPEHRLRLTFERIVRWSVASGVLWIAGALAPEGLRFAFWGPAPAVDLVAPVAGYWTPGLGRSSSEDYPVEGGHLAARFQAFVIIAPGGVDRGDGRHRQQPVAVGDDLLIAQPRASLDTACIVMTVGRPAPTCWESRCSLCA
jgi:Bacterial low temperature requirement A protein (LtrA)